MLMIKCMTNKVHKQLREDAKTSPVAAFLIREKVQPVILTWRV